MVLWREISLSVNIHHLLRTNRLAMSKVELVRGVFVLVLRFPTGGAIMQADRFGGEPL